ncbi:MAG: cell envelope integrity protein CreD [Pseudomonadota bacterium]
MSGERSPGTKLIIVAMIGAMLIVPLAMVFMLVGDRQHQARIAQNSVTAAWAGPQIVAGPTLVVPYIVKREVRENVDNKITTRIVENRQNLYISPSTQDLETTLDPEVRTRGSIHRSVVYEAAISGNARFVMPDDLERLNIKPEQLRLSEAFVQLPISDPRGLLTDARLSQGGEALTLRPGLGASQEGTGVHAFLDWSEGADVQLDFTYALRGSSAFSMVPRGEESTFKVKSEWQHPSFGGGFLPGDADKVVDETGFSASWSISNLALGQSLVGTGQPLSPYAAEPNTDYMFNEIAAPQSGQSMATIRLIEPVDLYKQVERSLKYGFLFIGFTFLAFLMFDIVGGAKVASAEYLLTGAGLILFFVMLLAFAEMIGFAWAYLIASAAIIGLLASYSAAVLGGWKRASFIAALLTGLYAVLYVLLNLEEWSLVIGSLMLFVALAAVMYATRNINWSAVTASVDDPYDTEPANHAAEV